MGYVNLSYCIGKTPKKVLGPTIFSWSGQEAVKVGPAKNLPRNLNFSTFSYIFAPKINILTQK